MKLIFIITGTGVGGAETMLHKVLTRLSPEFKPHVISMTPVGKIGEKLRALGIPVESLDMRRGVPNPIALMRLIRRLRDLKPDVVHTWMYHADLMGGVAARLAGVPALAWAIRHSNLAPADNKSQTLAVVRANAFLSHRVPDRILCCSEAARNIHVAFGYAPEKMVVVPNGFDLAHFKPDPNARLSVRAELGLSFDTAPCWIDWPMASTEEPCRISLGRGRGASTTAGRALPACRARSRRWQSNHPANSCRQWLGTGDPSAWPARRHSAPYGRLGRVGFFFFLRRGVS